MKTWLLLLITLLFTGCASPIASGSQAANASYPDLGLAPELVGDTWLNTDAPMHLSDLSGKVVLLEMWTFG